MKHFQLLKTIKLSKWIFVGAILSSVVAFTNSNFHNHCDNQAFNPGGMGSTKAAGAGTEQTCGTGCHGGPDNGSAGSIVVNQPSINPGVAVAGSVTLTIPTTVLNGTELCGFQLVAVNPSVANSTTQYGTFTAVSTTCSVNSTTGRLNHKQTTMTTSGSNKVYTWNYTYTAPTGATSVKFYVAGHGGPSGSQGNITYKNSLLVSYVAPVKFTQFTAAATPTNAVKLNFTTENETNIDHYEAEASVDGVNFNKVASINPLSNPGSSKFYTYTDNTNYLTAGTVYYRIKSVDAGTGAKGYTSVVAVKLNNRTKASLIINPNVTSGPLNIKFMQATESPIVLSVTDLNGRTIIKKNQNAIQGINNINLDLSSVPAGIYYVKISDGANSLIQSVLKN